MIWTKNQEQVVNSHLSLFSDSTKCFYCWTPKGFNPGKFMDELAKSGEEECYFSISLLRANIFFKARYLGFDHAGLQFRLPEKVFKVQRRKDLRFPIPDSLSLKVEFQDPLSPDSRLAKKVIDLSASGVSFLIKDDEAALYPVGLTLKDFTITVKNRKITLQGEIRNARPTRQDARAKGVIVGVAFKGIRAGDSQHIAGFVFEESRKYFSRFI